MRAFLALLLVFSHIVQLRASEQETTAQLETGYKAAADALRQTLTDALRRPEVVSRLLDPLHVSNKALWQASANLEKVLKRKQQNPWNHEEEGVRLDFVSDQPPSLRQDPNDLYSRFHSALLLRLSTLDKDGKVMSSVQTTIPVAADPHLRWQFPSQEEALAAIADVFNRAAKGRLEMAKEFNDRMIELKRLKGQKK